MRQVNLFSQKSAFDIPLIVVTILLVIFGLVIIYEASVVAAFRDFGDKLYYFKNQLIWASLGLFSLGFFSFFDYRKLIRVAPFLLAISILLLLIVLIPGVGTKIYGARRWISAAGFTFQPSEVAKLALVLYETAIISKFEKYKIKFTDALVVIFLPAAVISALVLLEPDLGTSLIFIAVALILYFVGRGPIVHFILIIPPIILAAVMAVFTHPYRIERVKSFFDPTHDPQGASYQIYQILIALSSGGLLGVGLGGSRSKFDFIPEIQSDAIFAVVVEELGFVGAVFLICLFLFLIKRSIHIARLAPDYQGKILAMGIIGLLSVQILFNLSSVVALVPLTGVPLPFISYGGSSLFVTMTSIGILLNIKRQS
ncbi:putative lipid II flippase FtsW [Candidatus Curtissbacteria bacterium]|nr:putative lipid II flippase FtsW [Candidatus Curtissbacteria bacterium]